MKEDISTSLLAFYGKVLEPELRSIKEKLSEHDDKFTRILDHFDVLYQRYVRTRQVAERNRINEDEAFGPAEETGTA